MSTKRRVFIVCDSYPPVLGGSEIEAQRVASGLIARGHQVRVLCSGGGPMPKVSEWVDPAKFQIATCRAAVSRGPEYDQGAAAEAKEKFEEFVKEHPDATLSIDAEKNINQLREKEAASAYNIAVFYEKQKQFESAKIYYADTINNYSESTWAKKAQEKLQLLENRKR